MNMENKNIEALWRQNEIQLAGTRNPDLTLLKKVELHNARKSVQSLLFLPLGTLLFYTLSAGYAFYFISTNWEVWYLAFSGAVVAFFSLLLSAVSIRQLRLISMLNYDAPVLRLQSQLSKLKLLLLSNLRIAAYMLPFGLFIGLFVVKALWAFDPVVFISRETIIGFAVLSIVLQLLSLLLLRALRSKNINKPWMRRLLKGSGSQLDEALGFLQEIETFEKEEQL
jgi:hypothetical protein